MPVAIISVPVVDRSQFTLRLSNDKVVLPQKKGCDHEETAYSF